MDDNNIRQAAGIQNHSRTLKEDIGKKALKVSAGQNREIPNVIFNKREEKIDKAGHSILIQRLEQGNNPFFFFFHLMAAYLVNLFTLKNGCPPRKGVID